MPPATPSAATPRPNLDLLRAVAVLLVVIDHTALARGTTVLPFGWNAAWLGLAGVFIFFVHTSLVLMWSLERKPHTLDFYIRRIFRIYPLTIVAVLLAVLSHAPLSGSVQHFFHYHHPSPRTLAAVLLLVQNFVPSPGLTSGEINIMGVLWSLPLEVQMYVVLPILYAYVRQERLLWPLIVVWFLACCVGFAIFLPDATDLPMVVPCFLPGIMAFLLYGRTRPRLPAFVLLPLLALLLELFMYHPTTRRGWIFCLLLGLSLPHIRELRSTWLTRPAHLLARYSFGIYLFHPFGLVTGFFLLAGRPLALQLLAELATIVVLSVAGYHLVESPMIRLGARLARQAEQRAERRASTPATVPF